MEPEDQQDELTDGDLDSVAGGTDRGNSSASGIPVGPYDRGSAPRESRVVPPAW